MTREITAKQRRFAEEYSIDLNAAAAGRRAGISGKTAMRYIKSPAVLAVVEEALKEQTERTKIDADWVQSKLVEIVTRSMQAEPVVDDRGSESGEWRYDGGTAVRALQLLAQRTGGFSSKMEFAGGAAVAVRVDITGDDAGLL